MKKEIDVLGLPKAKHELDKIREYEAKGYTSSFAMRMGRLTDLSSGMCYGVDDVKIVDEYRYEGMSDPSDMSILYVLEMHDGNKGLILRPYGPQATEEIDLYLMKISLQEKNMESRAQLGKCNPDESKEESPVEHNSKNTTKK